MLSKTSLSLLLISTAVEAAKTVNHPFVGEHANASSVQHANGSVSMRLGSVPASIYNKHAKFMPPVAPPREMS